MNTNAEDRDINQKLHEAMGRCVAYRQDANCESGRCVCGKAFTYHGIPAYDSDLNAAFDLVEFMRKSGRWCCIKIHSDYDHVWRVSFTRSSLELDDPHEPTASITDELLPRAIALAAIRALEVK